MGSRIKASGSQSRSSRDLGLWDLGLRISGFLPESFGVFVKSRGSLGERTQILAGFGQPKPRIQVVTENRLVKTLMSLFCDKMQTLAVLATSTAFAHTAARCHMPATAHSGQRKTARFCLRLGDERPVWKRNENVRRSHDHS